MYSQLLSNIPIFKDLAPDVLSDLSTRLRVLKVKKDDVLFRKEMEGTTLYIIQEGAIKVVLQSKSGEEMILNIFSEGDFFGEMSLLDGMPRSADAIALKPSVLLLLHRKDFLRLLKRDDSALEMFFSSLSRRLRKAEVLLEDTSFLNIPARFAKKLIELGETFGQRNDDAVEIGLRLTQTDLASMVGATRESINRELRILREKGLVTTTDRIIRLHNINRLQRRVH